MRLYAKDNITGILSGMADKDHFSHAVMFSCARTVKSHASHVISRPKICADTAAGYLREHTQM